MTTTTGITIHIRFGIIAVFLRRAVPLSLLEQVSTITISAKS